ncbi:MAG: leucine-rich repeat domain-containing protein, partial [Clostridia bacterium]|nr:leucine-rich repeat domain-containing protein [Clostridia bacterium]
KEITVDDENETFVSDDAGALLDKINRTLVVYPAANPATSYEVPEGIEAIGDLAFYDSLYLKNIYLPESLTYIGNEAFHCASALEEITIPESVEFIGFAAFAHCFSLKNVYMLTHDAEFNGIVYGFEAIAKEGFSYVQIAELIRQTHVAYAYGDYEKAEALQSEYLDSLIMFEELGFGDAVFYCHDDGKYYTIQEHTEYGLPVELYHPYDEEWTYDYDNNVRYRVCTFDGCEARLEEALGNEGNSDVEIIAPSDPEADFDVDKIEEGSDKYILVQNALSETDYILLKAFDITMKDKNGVHVQPGRTVKVKLPLDWEKNGSYKVFRVNEDGTLTDMNAYRQGSHMVFDTDHFSIYIIVEEKSQEAPEEPSIPDEPDEPAEPDIPDEPDTPDDPDTPDEPDEPAEPDIPDEPAAPEVPEAPEEYDIISVMFDLLIDLIKLITSFCMAVL